MILKIFLAASVALAVPAVAGSAPVTQQCAQAGPGTSFCAEGAFKRIDRGDTKGISYWLHPGGFISKVISERTRSTLATRSTIEARILSMLDARAESIGQAFEFVDLDSRTVHGSPFGTLTYRITEGAQATTVLHSYAAVEGVIVQVLSQEAPQGDAGGAAKDLRAAHHAALEALQVAAEHEEL